MSYARFGWNGSDVYVFLDCGGYLTCCACPLRPWGDEWFKAWTTAAMVAHLDEHRAAGHTVEEDTYAGLRADADENDAWIASQNAAVAVGEPARRTE